MQIGGMGGGFSFSPPKARGKAAGRGKGTFAKMMSRGMAGIQVAIWLEHGIAVGTVVGTRMHLASLLKQSGGKSRPPHVVPSIHATAKMGHRALWHSCRSDRGQGWLLAAMLWWNWLSGRAWSCWSRGLIFPKMPPPCPLLACTPPPPPLQVVVHSAAMILMMVSGVSRAALQPTLQQTMILIFR